jgi:hypothetical protein
MNNINEIKIRPVYSNQQEGPVGFYVGCDVPRWLEGLEKWSQLTMLFTGTEEECERYLERYIKEIVPENNLMLENLKGSPQDTPAIEDTIKAIDKKIEELEDKRLKTILNIK